ncbi:MAG: inorganic diphosphatase [Gemmatimonadaceae bacterium]|nr:inorganic diphosphatase [Gemmatimonadaceae bacterium]
MLYSAVHYPGDYGFIPRTLHEDNDPLDILVRINEPTFPGCQIDARPVGVLKMLDKGEPDDKMLAVPMHDPIHRRSLRHRRPAEPLPRRDRALLQDLQGSGREAGGDHRLVRRRGIAPHHHAEHRSVQREVRLRRRGRLSRGRRTDG